MNRLKKLVGDAVLKSDLLSANVSLRYGGSSIYESFCPGIVSILVVSFFIAIFIIKLMSVLQLQNISAFQHLTDNVESAKPIQDIMLAMTIDGLWMRDLDSYFQFSLTEVTLSRPTGSTIAKTRTERTIALLPCKMDYWQSMNIQNMDTIFTKRGMSAFYCPTEKFYIQGTSDEDTYIYSELKLKRCNTTSTSPVCTKNQTLQQQYYDNYVKNNEYFTVKMFLKDSIISPTQQNAVSNYLERDILISFSNETGTTGYVKIADYEIDTDTNILPWSDYTTQQGYFVERFQTATIPSTNKFVYIKFQKSTKKLTVEREYGKIDEMLSYVGGLFGLLFYCIEFVMSSYNEYRYELGVGEVLFNYDQKGDQVKENDMHFWTYLKYSLFDWVSFLGIDMKWRQMQKLDDTRSQINEQLDIRYLMSRIRYLQNVAEVLVNEDQRTCLLLTELPTLNKIRKIRKVAEFYVQNRHQNQAEKPQKQGLDPNDSQNKLIELSENVNPSKQNPFAKLNLFGLEENVPVLDIVSFMLKHVTQNEGAQKTPQQLEEQLAEEVSDALTRVCQDKQDPINQKILSKLRPQVLKRIKTKAKSVSNARDQIFIQLLKDDIMTKKMGNNS